MEIDGLLPRKVMSCRKFKPVSGLVATWESLKLTNLIGLWSVWPLLDRWAWPRCYLVGTST